MYIGDLRIFSMRVDNANDVSIYDEEERGHPRRTWSSSLKTRARSCSSQRWRERLDAQSSTRNTQHGPSDRQYESCESRAQHERTHVGRFVNDESYRESYFLDCESRGGMTPRAKG